MPTKPDFRNLDLSQIWDAITAGGGGGDALAGQLLNGTATPQFPNNFYPAAIRGTYELLNGTAAPPTPYGFYPYYFEQIHNLIQNDNLLLNGVNEPMSLAGFYPAKITQIEGSLFQLYGFFFGDTAPSTALADTYPYWFKNVSDKSTEIADNTNVIQKLLNGNSNPEDYNGFYPDTLFKIKENTSATQIAVEKFTQAGSSATGGAVTGYGADGFASSLLASQSLATYLNGLTGQFTILNITFTHVGGVNGHGYNVLYR